MALLDGVEIDANETLETGAIRSFTDSNEKMYVLKHGQNGIATAHCRTLHGGH